MGDGDGDGDVVGDGEGEGEGGGVGDGGGGDGEPLDSDRVKSSTVAVTGPAYMERRTPAVPARSLSEAASVAESSHDGVAVPAGQARPRRDTEPFTSETEPSITYDWFAVTANGRISSSRSVKSPLLASKITRCAGDDPCGRSWTA